MAGGATPHERCGADALTDGAIDLWFDDGTHASKYGSYLSALTLFGTLTGRDPSSLGGGEIAARDLGIAAADALVLQRIAAQQLGFSDIHEPGTLALVGLAVGIIGLGRRGGPGAAAARRRSRR